MVQTLDTTFVLKGPHPNAARLFDDFLVSADGQGVLARAGYIPANPDVPPQNPSILPKAKSTKAMIFGPKEVNDNLEDWIATYKRIFG